MIVFLMKLFLNFSILLAFLPFVANSSGERQQLVDDIAAITTTPRCPSWISERYPKTSEKEKKIYKEMLRMAEKDQIVRNLMIKAGKLQGSIKLIKYSPINIEIVYHMHIGIKNGTEVGFIPTTAFEKQSEVMNAAFADTGLTFSIKEIKTYNDSAYFSTCDDQEDAMKAATAVLPEKYLNIWTCDTRYLGFAYLPFDLPDTSYLHGVVLDYQALPKVDGYATYAQYDEGDTLVHEAGHFFGLYHTFDGGCKDGSSGGDMVSDTAAEAQEAFGMACLDNPPRDTCPDLPGVDPVTNYMDYSDDACLDHFTALQHARMRTMLINYKPIMANVSPTPAPTRSPFPFCGSLKNKKKCNKYDVCDWQKVGKKNTCIYVPCITVDDEMSCVADKNCKWKKNKCIKK